MLGDIFKVASYPLAYALLATGGSRVFMLFEVLATAIFVGSSALLLPRIGLSGAGAGYSIMYLIYLPLVLVAGRTRMRVSWDAAVWRELLLLVIGACAVFIIAPSDALMSGLVGAAVALVVAVRSFLRLRSQDRLNSTMDVTDP
jgi:PST family polysaccharide transporter